jgi:hypothetical protein
MLAAHGINLDGWVCAGADHDEPADVREVGGVRRRHCDRVLGTGSAVPDLLRHNVRARWRQNHHHHDCQRGQRGVNRGKESFMDYDSHILRFTHTVSHRRVGGAENAPALETAGLREVP